MEEYTENPWKYTLSLRKRTFKCIMYTIGYIDKKMLNFLIKKLKNEKSRQFSPC